MEFLKDLIPVLKERTTVFLIGVIMLAIGLLQRFFAFDLTLATGIALVGIVTAWVAWDCARAGWRKLRAPKNRTPEQVDDVMRRAHWVLTREGLKVRLAQPTNLITRAPRPIQPLKT